MQHGITFFVFLSFGCTGSSLLHVSFLQLWQAGATLCCGAWPSHCCDFSCCGAWALGMQASVVAACRLSSCGAQAWLPHAMQNLSRPGTESMSLALAGGFLTTGPLGKSYMVSLICGILKKKRSVEHLENRMVVARG